MAMLKRMMVLSAQQLAWLERETKRLQLKSVNELIRRIIDEKRETETK